MYIEIERDYKMITEILGFTALAILLVSLSVDDIKKLRYLGILAAALFLIQASMLESLSLIASNLSIITIHAWKIFTFPKEEMVTA